MPKMWDKANRECPFLIFSYVAHDLDYTLTWIAGVCKILLYWHVMVVAEGIFCLVSIRK